MANKIATIMYHYVRPLESSRHPGISGLEADSFRQQIAYIQRHFNVISGFELEHAIAGDADLPDRAALLTFDDGYLDHFTTVLPVLHAAGLSGSFFPPVDCITKRRVLDVNKLHYILASAPSADAVVTALDAEVDMRRSAFSDLKPIASYKTQFATPSRYDTADVAYVKSMLQHGLPQPIRSQIVDELFNAFVGVPEEALANELYMTVDQLKMLVRMGMHVGSHSVTHRWMNRIPLQEQRAEVEQSLEFLERIGVPIQDGWTMCYPYGGHDASLRAILRDRGCLVGHTIRVDVARIGDEPLSLPRLDTNDLPKDAGAPANQWVKAVDKVFPVG